jgi:hypothetical protein
MFLKYIECICVAFAFKAISNFLRKKIYLHEKLKFLLNSDTKIKIDNSVLELGAWKWPRAFCLKVPRKKLQLPYAWIDRWDVSTENATENVWKSGQSTYLVATFQCLAQWQQSLSCMLCPLSRHCGPVKDPSH